MRTGWQAAGVRALVVLVAVVTAACSVSSVGSTGDETAAAPTTTSTSIVPLPSTTVAPPTTAAPTTAPPTTAPPTTSAPAPAPVSASARTVAEQYYSPFATVGGVTLYHPSTRVEMIGFHESSHDGAQQLTPADSARAWVTLDSRGRGTGSRTAADIVADPNVEIRSPVTGTVVRAGTYVLYCEHYDDFAVIEPDERPGWEVKLLHIDGVQVSRGQRVQAGATVIARGPTTLPFESQVDRDSASPSWPHVHIEVVDPSIPDRPGAGC
ncbi:MAG: M23 family metallopeptidase [Actinomycetota bacterium]|nr:M23 family metallopeptidase [Actinomycetota bacterium]